MARVVVRHPLNAVLRMKLCGDLIIGERNFLQVTVCSLGGNDTGFHDQLLVFFRRKRFRRFCRDAMVKRVEKRGVFFPSERMVDPGVGAGGKFQLRVSVRNGRGGLSRYDATACSHQCGELASSLQAAVAEIHEVGMKTDSVMEAVDVSVVHADVEVNAAVFRDPGRVSRRFGDMDIPSYRAGGLREIHCRETAAVDGIPVAGAEFSGLPYAKAAAGEEKEIA